MLYKDPYAKILTHQTLSSNFRLCRGTRQGCALSPLLFALAIEPLAQTVRHTDITHPDIYGYHTKHTTNKISIYADDILLFISQPQVSIDAILSLVDQFGTFSGYRITWQKSELMPIRLTDHQWLSQVPFKVTKERFTYLGIVVTKDYNNLFKANFDPLIENLRSNIQFWRTLPISLLGRINAIYPTAVVPLTKHAYFFITKAFFNHLDSISIPFVWDYKTHRIGKAHLCKSKTCGGLALPN